MNESDAGHILNFILRTVFCKAAALTICYSGIDFFKLPSQLKPPQEAMGLGTFMSIRVLNLRALGSGREEATTR